jgi:hypothetical protein
MKNNNLKELLTWALKYNSSAKIEGDYVVVGGSFNCYDNKLTSLPDSIGKMKIGGSFSCSNNKLTFLPESIGEMRIGGGFYCSYNKLTFLPESIGEMRIGGGFNCSHNKLTSLPESIGDMRIGGDFYCRYNQLTSLPESIGNMRIGGGFYCYNNKLTSLPESIGKMKIGGGFYCHKNQLTFLPESIGNMKIGGDFYCSYNKLTFLPKSIGNMKVGGSFSCSYNKLTFLPESIGNMKIGGDFYCSNNQLPNNYPVPQKLKEGIYDDYTYLDGILIDIISKKIIDGRTVIKHSFGYVVSDGTDHAHGKDLRTALLDLHFKTSKKDLSKYKNIDTSINQTIEFLYEMYRNITGACSFGTQNWMKRNEDFVKRVEESGASIDEVMKKTEGEYGNQRLKEFFGK